MLYEIQILKLKKLIQACKDSGDFEPLASAVLILTSNLVNEIGINLGIRPREHESGETIGEYMDTINQVFLEINLSFRLDYCC